MNLETFYPEKFSEWLALVAAISPLLVGAVAAWWRVWTYYKEWRSGQWKRMQELLIILYNKDFQHGGWAQVGAVRELETLGVPQRTIFAVADRAKHFWESTNGSDDIIRELDRVSRRTEGNILKRAWRRIRYS